MDIAGVRQPPAFAEALRVARRAFASLTLKLVVLVGIFVGLPVVLYGQFEAADRHARDLVIRSMKDRTWLIAQILTPLLDQLDPARFPQLNRELARYIDPGTTLRLLLQPTGTTGPQEFYYVASAPSLAPSQVGTELNTLAEQGVIARLSESCSWERPLDIRYRQRDGSEELLTSLVPIKAHTGCWLLVSVHNTAEFLDTSIGRPYWRTPEIRFAALSYLAFAILAALMAVSVSRSLKHFSRVTRQMRKGRIAGPSFADHKVAPELTSVAMEFDRLVHDLRATAQGIRQRAEDHAHSIKAPLGTIALSLEPIKRAAAVDDAKLQRAVRLIESSLERLRVQVNLAQRLDRHTADLIDAPQVPIDLTMVVDEVLLRFRQAIVDRDVRIDSKLEPKIRVMAGKGILDVVVENILDNAIGFCPRGKSIAITLQKRRKDVILRIEDEGPGIRPGEIDHIFDRYVSLRRPEDQAAEAAKAANSAEHAGLGLWIVRRNVESLGGKVSAANRPTGGLAIEIVLPAAD